MIAMMVWTGGMDVPREKLLTISEAAERLGVHQNTLRSWADKGMVPVVKLPSGYRRFRPSDIERELQRQERHTSPGPIPRTGKDGAE